MKSINMNFKSLLGAKKQKDEWVSKERSGKGSIAGRIKEDQSIMLELLNILTYMSSIVTSDISRSDVFKLAGEQDGTVAKSMKKVHSLVVNYGYDSANACKLASEEAHHPALKDFLIRFSNALGTGEDEEKFLRGETDTIREVYINNYQSDIESLKKWTDGYAALLVSVILVIAVFLISTSLFSMGDPYTTGIISGVLLCFISFFGVYVLFRSAPYEIIVHSLEIKSREQELAGALSSIILPVTAVVSIIMILMGVKPWLIFLLDAALFAPIGIIGMIDLKHIMIKDMALSTFLKSLGSTAGIMGATLGQAMGQLDKKSVGALEEDVNVLHKRLFNGIKPRICWRNFIGETGSELVNKSICVFLDSIELGGDATKIGNIVSQSALGIALLRAKRKMVSAGFMNLLIPLHTTMCGVLVFIYQMMFSFNNAIMAMMASHAEDVEGAAETMPAGMSFFGVGGNVDLGFLGQYVTVVVLILTISNAFAAQTTAGGSKYTLFFYLSALLFMSAIVLYVVPILAGSMFVLPTEGGM